MCKKISVFPFLSSLHFKAYFVVFSASILSTASAQTDISNLAIDKEQKVTASQLQKDFDILEMSLKKLHPGLYRYVDSLNMESHFLELKNQLDQDLGLKEAYLHISQFLGKIKCGHTYANFWNQSDRIKAAVIDQPDKLPFSFRILDNRILVSKNVSEEQRLDKYAEVLSINGVETGVIIQNLLPLVKADGANDGKRLNDLQLFGVGAYESFDVYFPLLYPPVDGNYTLEIHDHGTMEKYSSQVAAISRAERKEKLAKKYGPQPDKLDDLWEFELLGNKTAYLKLGTFVIWKMEMNWKKFLRNAFVEISKNGVEHLIIDIRGNEGGADEVSGVLSGYLIQRALVIEDDMSDKLRYDVVPSTLSPYLQTWDQSFMDLRGKLKPLGYGYYGWKNRSNDGIKINPRKPGFTGKVYLLVDASNSSATFFLARKAQELKLATLVGQQTGGNKQGINGGMMFMVTLPNSRIEVDIPLINFAPKTVQPDEGIEPDVKVIETIEDVFAGRDLTLEKAIALINNEE